MTTHETNKYAAFLKRYNEEVALGNDPQYLFEGKNPYDVFNETLFDAIERCRLINVHLDNLRHHGSRSGEVIDMFSREVIA